MIPECADPTIPQTAFVKDPHDGAWWQAATSLFNFTKPDALDSVAFNRVLWKRITGDQKPYPARREANNPPYPVRSPPLKSAWPPRSS